MVLRLSGLTYSYKAGEKVLSDLSMEVREGEIASLLGRSGSGKTTVLNLIAGFLRPDSGRIEIDSKEVSHLMPGKRGIGMVMQDLALFPNMTAIENVEYGLKAQGIPGSEAARRSCDILERMEMSALKDRSVLNLSGGERQRVALARSLVYRPKLLLMDEPLSALDPSLREDLRKDVKRILMESGITTLYVTHDRTEALSISDRVFVMDDGRIAEEGTPRQMFRRPRTLTGARFMGISTPIPILEMGPDTVTTPFGTVAISARGQGSLGYRPEEVKWSDPGDSLSVKGTVLSCEYRGRDHLISIRTGSGVFIGHSGIAMAEGTHANFFVRRKDLFLLV